MDFKIKSEVNDDEDEKPNSQMQLSLNDPDVLLTIARLKAESDHE